MLLLAVCLLNQEREDERPLCWETKKAVSLVYGGRRPSDYLISILPSCPFPAFITCKEFILQERQVLVGSIFNIHLPFALHGHESLIYVGSDVNL